MKKALAILFFLGCCLNTQSQNLLRNGSFEKFIKKSEYSSQIAIREGMPTNSEWLNTDTLPTISPTDCPPPEGGNRFMLGISGTSLSNDSCGDGSSLPNAYFKSIDGRKLIMATGGPNNVKKSVGYWHKKYLAQKLSFPLIKDHQYFFGLFYNMDLQIVSCPFRNEKSINACYQFNIVIKMDLYGVGLSTQRLESKKPYHPRFMIEGYKEQRKLRLDATYSKNWQPWREVFTADSAFQYLTFGDFWDNNESTVVYENTYPPSIYNDGLYSTAFDSFVLWDVTLQIKADTVGCINTVLPIRAVYYSRGDSCKWFNKNGQSLGTGDSISIRLEQDTWVFCEKYFPEIEFLQKDSLLIKTNKAGPSFKVNRTGDVCTLPAHLLASPPNLNYFWEGKTDTTSYYIAPNAGSINLHVTENTGCKTDTVIQVDAPMQFSSQLIGDSCKLPISIALLPSSYQYSWNGETSNPLDINETGNVLLQALDNKGCKKDTSLFIVTPPNFSINYVIDSCKIPTLVGFVPTQLQYSFQNTPIANPFEVEKNKSYTIEARNAWNCVATKSITVPDCEALAAKNVYIPNAFTPNSNFLNEAFFPVGLGIKTYQINIYSRWGEQLFAGAANQEWQAPNYQDGVYLYQIAINFKNGSMENFAVEVHLLR